MKIFCLFLMALSVRAQLGTSSSASSSASSSSSSGMPVSTNVHCSNKETCGACIRTPGCIWCAQPGAAVRCMSYLVLCPNNVFNNPTPQMDITKMVPLKSGNSRDEAVQITPQLVRIKLRPGPPLELRFRYSQAEDYPVDLYYLMDLSNSMKDDKETLSTLGSKLSDAMRALTSNFLLGFGSFVDKTDMPFVNTVPHKLLEPCTGKEKCSSPYSFKNHLPLSDDPLKFSAEVKRAIVSGNIDSPEGGFDALMQAIVCHEEIGWRAKARHMIVFSTDADYHYAGDGKLAGIVEPNDGLCHMKNNEYTHGLKQDYPSIAQINNKAKEHNMIIIFAVVENVNATYSQLKDQIEGSQSGVLDKSSSNVVQFVKDQYEKLVQGVTMTDDSPAEIDVHYKSKCLGVEEMDTNSCSGIRKGDILEFTATVTVRVCPSNSSLWRQTFKITPKGLSESMTVEVEMDCECQCEKPNQPGYVQNAVECNRKGSQQCGVCVCNPGNVGESCQCSASAATSGQEGNSKTACQADENSGQICSGRGECECEQCNCNIMNNPDERVWGRYCECDNFKSCGTRNGKVCSGSDHGTCNCGQCDCEPGWTGQMCECSTSSDTCMPPASLVAAGGVPQQICSGNGDCECGVCVRCHDKDGQRYTGKYCEECPTCPGRCEELQNCVEQLAYLTEDQNDLIPSPQCQFTLHKLDNLTETAIAEALHSFESRPQVPQALTAPRALTIEDTMEQGEILETPDGGVTPWVVEPLPDTAKLCSHPDQVGCTYSFRYLYNTTGYLHVFALNRKECGEQQNILAVVLGVIGTILLAGLLLLVVWKVATTIHDRKEYAKFENERKLAKWDAGDNPLYVEATTHFNNPTFGGAASRKSQLPQ